MAPREKKEGKREGECGILSVAFAGATDCGNGNRDFACPYWPYWPALDFDGTPPCEAARHAGMRARCRRVNCRHDP